MLDVKIQLIVLHILEKNNARLMLQEWLVDGMDLLVLINLVLQLLLQLIQHILHVMHILIINVQ